MSISAKNLIEIQKKQNKKRRFRTLLFILIFLFVTYRGLFSILLISADIKITAHRGSTVLSPENSISSVVEALALNVDYIEVDAQLTKDGKVILLHDRTFKRTAGITSKPKDLTYEEMQNINVITNTSHEAETGRTYTKATLKNEETELLKLFYINSDDVYAIKCEELLKYYNNTKKTMKGIGKRGGRLGGGAMNRMMGQFMNR